MRQPFPVGAIAEAQAFLADADPDRVTTERAAELVKQFADLERLASSIKLFFARRLEESTTWAAEGHRSAASWLADTQQGTLGAAISTLETSRRLAELPATTEALRAGQLSPTKATPVSLGAEKDPTAEAELLAIAESDSYKNLQSRLRQVLASSASKEDELDRYRAIRRSRFLRSWSDVDGACRLEAKLTPDDGARVISAIGSEADCVFERHRKDEDRESPSAYRADALVALLTGRAASDCRTEGDDEDPATAQKRRAGRTDTVVVRVDATALRRGHVGSDETCEIAGVGPVSVATVRQLLPESFVKVVFRDSVDVLSVCHVGRLLSAHLLSALEERDPVCVVPGCDMAKGLEAHHWREDYAVSRTTRLDGLARVCRFHHHLLTYDGFVLEGGPGKWDLVAPEDPELRDTG